MSDEFDNLGYGKRPFYKRVWFWILVVILIILLSIGIAMSYMVTDIKEQAEARLVNPIMRSSTVVVQNITNDDGNIDNSKAKAVTLNSGKYAVGKEIEQGFYIVQTLKSGKISVYNSKNEKIQETDVVDKGGSIPLKSIFLLKEGDTLEITGMSSVKFSPYKRDFKTVLSTGTYEVGVDIKQGDYIMEIPSSSGMVSVNNPIGIPLFSQILNNQGSQNIKLTLANGDSINVNGVSGIHLVGIDKSNK
ncbi:hypothetical protein [uncultured Clostridium sp.]|jgi:hypothetical protein|uniref:hypothetical protein n=1 Tax=uncultured Clostridium sp. TaxID=59620 RepID=UPI0026376F15|nr:hypothetical protein [uncultured Clostridium sp.]